MAAKKTPAKKKAPAKKAPAKKPDIDRDAIMEAMAVGFAGRTSPTKLADSYAAIWRVLYPKKEFKSQPWAPWTTGYGKS